MSNTVEEIGKRLDVASTGTPADAELRALRHALDSAYGYLNAPAAKAPRWLAVDHGGGVRSIYAGEPMRHCLEVDASVLCERFGTRLVAAFLRLMAGTGRIASLLHLIRLNSNHAPPKSVAKERNFQLAALLTWAYLNELTVVLNDLSGAGIARHLTDPKPWAVLQQLQRHWERDARATMRDNVMFHLGFKDETQKQMDEQAKAHMPLPLVERDVGHADTFMRFTAGDALVMTASGLGLSDFDDLAREAVDMYGPLFESVHDILSDLLRQLGARLPDVVRHNVTLV
jgi:hypothetical protein